MGTNDGRNAYMRKYMKNYLRTHADFAVNLKKRNAAKRVLLKTEVLRHYGKRQNLQCCWRGCKVVDVDMLTLDHVDDNGANHRSEITSGKYRSGGGMNIYYWVKKQGFPDGFQTLCHNHQWKKEILRRRSNIGIIV